MSIQSTPVLLRWFIQILNNTNTKIQILNVQLHKKGFFSHSGLKAHWCFSLLLFLYCFLDILKLDLLIFSHRVAKCHRYGRLICVNFLEVWGKILSEIYALRIRVWHSWKFWYEWMSEYIRINKITRMNIRIYSY